MAKDFVITTIRIDREDYQKIHEFSDSRQIPIATVIRKLVKDGLSGIDRKQADLLEASERLNLKMEVLIEEMRTCTQYSGAAIVLGLRTGATLELKQDHQRDDVGYEQRKIDLMSELTKKAFLNANNISVAYESGLLTKRSK